MSWPPAPTFAQARCRGLLTRKRVRAKRQRQARGGGGRAVEASSGGTEGVEGAEGAQPDAEARHELLRGFEPMGMLSSCVAVARSKLAARGDVAEFDWLPANPQPNPRLCGFDMGFDCGLAARKPGADVVQVRTPRPHMLEAVRSLISF